MPRTIEDITICKASKSRLEELDFNTLPFGKVYTDHMLVALFKDDKWGKPEIKPYENLTISAGSPAIHYGQSIFEGTKAYRKVDDKILTFRIEDNWKRFNASAHRMCMPNVPKKLFIEGINTLLDIDRAWVPHTPDGSLYVRPFLFSADDSIGIRPSKDFFFMIIACPVGAYYSTPVKILIETKYTRAIQGGTGTVKAGGNYGGALYPAKIAQELGYHQLIWTDGVEHQYIEEAGTMNIMFVIGNTLVTPALTDSILKGITRDSILTLARSWGIAVEERKITVQELIEGLQSQKVTEAFGVGTAATIAHITLIGYEGKDYKLPSPSEQSLSKKIFSALNDIKRGRTKEQYGWVHSL